MFSYEIIKNCNICFKQFINLIILPIYEYNTFNIYFLGGLSFLKSFFKGIKYIKATRFLFLIIIYNKYIQ